MMLATVLFRTYKRTHFIVDNQCIQCLNVNELIHDMNANIFKIFEKQLYLSICNSPCVNKLAPQ